MEFEMRKSMIAALALAGLMMTAPAHAQTTRIEKSFDNWRVDCQDDGKTKKCGMIYALVSRKTKKIVFSWSVVPKPDTSGINKAIIRTPTGVKLADGVTIVFPGAKPLNIAYATCVSQGCLAELDLSAQWTKALSSQAKMTINYNSFRGTPLQHEVKLDKFKEAFDFYLSQVKSN